MDKWNKKRQTSSDVHSLPQTPPVTKGDIPLGEGDGFPALSPEMALRMRDIVKGDIPLGEGDRAETAEHTAKAPLFEGGDAESIGGSENHDAHDAESIGGSENHDAHDAESIGGGENHDAHDAESIRGSENYAERAGESKVREHIGQAEITKAAELLKKYRQGKTNLDRRIVENDQWWRLRHWDVVGRTAENELQPTSAWLFNSVANKHGDAMDNAPEPVVLPRESGDIGDAQTLSEILPVIAEHNDFEGIYSDAMWDKCKSGTAAYCVTWDTEAENGLGDISIRRASLLNLFWEPGVSDIQDSANLFYTSMLDNAVLKQRYPQLENKGTPVQGARYVHDDQIDTQDKSMVVDWYYKTRDETGRQAVHYCKFVGDTVLYASQNDPAYQDGYYSHGKYPFVLDRLYPIEDSPAGFGYIDIMQSPQLYIDKLDAVVLKNAMLAGKPRWFIRDSCAVNQEEFADWSKDFVHVAGRLEDGDIKQIQVDTLPAYLVGHMRTKIDELKETSGNRDFAQGGTSAGVTAAAAITALQEAGNKLSRDMLKGTYRAYRKIMELCIELIRQFYNAEREFRITGQDGKTDFVHYSNTGIRDQPLPPAYPGQELEPGYLPAVRRPVFDVIVKAQKSNPYSQISQNETAKELYQLGVFQPENAEQALTLLSMMEFEGKRQVEDKLQNNVQTGQRLMQMEQMIEKMALLLRRQGAALPQSPMATAPSEREPMGAVLPRELSGEGEETERQFAGEGEDQERGFEDKRKRERKW